MATAQCLQRLGSDGSAHQIAARQQTACIFQKFVRVGSKQHVVFSSIAMWEKLTGRAGTAGLKQVLDPCLLIVHLPDVSLALLDCLEVSLIHSDAVRCRCKFRERAAGGAENGRRAVFQTESRLEHTHVEHNMMPGAASPLERMNSKRCQPHRCNGQLPRYVLH